jgi:hypothetical protein
MEKDLEERLSSGFISPYGGNVFGSLSSSTGNFGAAEHFIAR